jgi:hypothetical protein
MKDVRAADKNRNEEEEVPPPHDDDEHKHTSLIDKHLEKARLDGINGREEGRGAVCAGNRGYFCERGKRWMVAVARKDRVPPPASDHYLQ